MKNEVNNTTFLSDIILPWYDAHKRLLPWRDTGDPYKIWLSEIILQQTRISQGMAYYQRFIEQFPCVEDMAAASEDKILKLWEGLGYYSRARNMHATARIIAQKGAFPNSAQELIRLKGIGPYTAAAISSIAFGECIAAVDGNAYRVLGRIFAIDTPFDTTVGKHLYQQLANSMIAPERPGDFNQAIMDFGSLQCTPLSPQCLSCPLAIHCIAHSEGKEEQYPVKSKTIRITQRYLHYYLIMGQGKVLIHKRNDQDIWKRLYEPFLIESPHPCDPLTINHPWLEQAISLHPHIHIIARNIPHQLTHRQLLIDFVIFSWETDISLPPAPDGYEYLPIDSLSQLAFPIPVRKWLTDIQLPDMH